MKLLPLALLLAACAPEIDMSLVVDPPIGATEAEQVILAAYNCKKAIVYWFGPDAMTCPGGQSFHSPVSGNCVRATSWDDTIVVGHTFAEQPVWSTEFVHEYEHFALDPARDGSHSRLEIWGDYNHGHPGGLVEETRTAIANALCTFDPIAHETTCVMP